jgi:hypothetical protein
MADLQTYTKLACNYNLQHMAEETNVTIKRISGAQVVKTVAKGFAGMSPGSPMMEITFKSAIPAAGFELTTIGEDMRDLVVREVTVFGASKSITTKGFVTEDNTQHGADNVAELDFTMQCEWADWE